LINPSKNIRSEGSKASSGRDRVRKIPCRECDHRLKHLYEGFHVENMRKLDREDMIYTDLRKTY
jgi:hypothetical protein